ncbi:MAG: glycolate oxidase iron-sulfur subunit [Gemmatimonadetes bacterium]|nr:glycolate oxidase iron-sulfur subunit [Gemmatimonadota bacterium]
MRTAIPEQKRKLPGVADAETILRTCVHCGFCNATCPTYLLTGNELEGPRGRIYLMKNALENQDGASARTLEHIDNCLGCLSCETTCPSGVNYAHLLEDGRTRLEPLRRRAVGDRLQRALLARLLPSPRLLRPALHLARWLRPLRYLLPSKAARMLGAVPTRLTRAQIATPGVHRPAAETKARVALLTGCAQQVLGAQINDAAVRLLTRMGMEVTIPSNTSCCGALTHHMGERSRSQEMMARAVDQWEELLNAGVEAIVLTTSGCQTAVADYGHLFTGSDRAAAAQRVSAAACDITQFLDRWALPEIREMRSIRLAYHDACSMQHGLRWTQTPRELLRRTGAHVLEIPEGHICCGSAGTYHLLRVDFSTQLQERKAIHIREQKPDVVVSGNIGCLEQLASAVPETPFVHTVQWLDWATGGPCPPGLEELLAGPQITPSSTTEAAS